MSKKNPEGYWDLSPPFLVPELSNKRSYDALQLSTPFCVLRKMKSDVMSKRGNKYGQDYCSQYAWSL